MTNVHMDYGKLWTTFFVIYQINKILQIKCIPIGILLHKLLIIVSRTTNSISLKQIASKIWHNNSRTSKEATLYCNFKNIETGQHCTVKKTIYMTSLLELTMHFIL